MVTIMTNVAMNNKAERIIGGVSAMLIITLSIPNGETFLYFCRIFENLYRRFVAILVNSDVDRIQDFLKKYKKLWIINI